MHKSNVPRVLAFAQIENFFGVGVIEVASHHLRIGVSRQAVKAESKPAIPIHTVKRRLDMFAPSFIARVLADTEYSARDDIVMLLINGI